jgi:hypothetical protein
MKTRYRLTRRGNRGGVFYCKDTLTGKRSSLDTDDQDAAEQIVLARNQAERQPMPNLQIARAYARFGEVERLVPKALFGARWTVSWGLERSGHSPCHRD